MGSGLVASQVGGRDLGVLLLGGSTALASSAYFESICKKMSFVDALIIHYEATGSDR